MSHLTLFNRNRGEMAEMQLCESKQLAINTLRMTFEAKVLSICHKL